MLGMSRLNGGQLDGVAHIQQSIQDILTTPRGSRVMLREYGSDIPDLVDQPMNELFDVELHAAVAQALDLWEPRFRLSSVAITGRTSAGRIALAIEGIVISEGRAVRLEGITL